MANPNINIGVINESDLSTQTQVGKLIFTETGKQFIIKSDGGKLQITDIITVDTLPSSPIHNKIYILSSQNYSMNYYDGSAWHKLNDNQIIIGTTAPTDTTKLWLDTTSIISPILKWYNGTSWINISGNVTDIQITDWNNIKTEVETARNGETNLDIRLDKTDTKIGDLTTLTTTDKTSLVNAINCNTSDLSEKANQSELNTTNTNVSNHLSDLVSDSDGAHGLKIEEGTWTPTIIGNSGATGQTYTTQKGTYYKIGKLVYIRCLVQLSVKGTMSGTISMIGGLPFQVTGGSPNNFNGEIIPISFDNIDLATGQINIIGLTSASGTTIGLNGLVDNGAKQSIASSQISDTTTIQLSGCYRTA